MNCEDFERAWQELDNPSLFSPAMEDHRSGCAPCAARVRDVNLLRWEARQLIETEEPPDRLWLSIRQQLDREGLTREPGERSWLAGLTTFGWLPRLPMGLAYASVFLLALVGGDYLRDRMTPAPATAPLPPTAMIQSAAEPAADSDAPAAAPAREEEKVIQKVIEKAPPEKRAIYLTRWQELNSSSDVLRNFVAAHPDDPLAVMQLSENREQQRRFLESVMRWELEEF